MSESDKAETKGGQPGETQAEGAAEARQARALPAAALRALAEAEERRKAMDAAPPLPAEVNGRKGPEPVRYGDWEKKGIAVDF